MTVPPGFAAREPATALVYVADLDTGTIEVEGDDGHHLQRVRRLAAGEPVVAADGGGRWMPCTVTSAADGRVLLASTGPPRVEPRLAPRVAVAFAPAKGDQAADVVHALVELGVDRIIPIECERSVVRWHGERAARAGARLRRVAREAAMLARRAWLPVVDDPAAVVSLAGHPAPVLGDARGEPVDALTAPIGGEWLLISGPEGGFAPGELDQFPSAAALAVGAHVLRARTAPVALAAAIAGRRQPDGAAGSSSAASN